MMRLFQGATLVLVSVCFFSPLGAYAARLYAETTPGAFGPGDTFVTSIRVDNEDMCINAGRVVLTYDPRHVKAVDFSRGGSLFTLWIADPFFDTERGEVVFEGGIPGGYCGRIQGDPALTNVLGRVIFTVVNGDTGQTTIHFSPNSEFYVSDGVGTRAPLSSLGATVTLLAESTGAPNTWIREVEEDVTPPEAFSVRVESTDGVFNGDYYAVFGTVDKQSGLSHFEIFERNAWKRVSSPYRLRDQTLDGGVTLRAIDKAGNERIATFDNDAVPKRLASARERLIFGIFVVLLILGGAVAFLVDRRRARRTPSA